MFYKIWLGLLAAVLLSLFWVGTPYLVSAYYLARGTEALANQENPAAGDDLKTALYFEPDNALAYRRLAQAYLQADQPEQALAMEQQALALAPHNAVVELEVGDIYDRLGNSEQAIAHYEAGTGGDRRAQLTANYLQTADQLWTGGEQEGAVAIWRDKVIGSGYGDLYANWRLARYYADDEETAAVYKDDVRYFPLESVAPPPDRHLDKYQALTFAGAVADGLWTRETLLNVVAYRVWQDQSQATERLLQLLLAEHPDDADVCFYLGEMYQRRGDWEQAEAVYRQTLGLDANYAPAYLRLGLAAEASCEAQATSCTGLEAAAEWYRQYHQLQPDDLIGLQKLVEVYETLSRPEVGPLRTELKARTDDQQLVAENLHLDLDEFELGENLLKDIQLQDGQIVQGGNWEWNAWRGPTNSDALFAAGQDGLEEKSGARTVTLWERSTTQDGILPYADYSMDIVFEANTFYVLSLYYKADKFKEGSAFVALLEFVLQPRFVFVHTNLPDTSNLWQKLVFVGQSYQEPLKVKLLLRNWGSGDVLFDQVTLRQVNLSR